MTRSKPPPIATGSYYATYYEVNGAAELRSSLRSEGYVEDRVDVLHTARGYYYEKS